jgi:hypothetical protein
MISAFSALAARRLTYYFRPLPQERRRAAAQANGMTRLLRIVGGHVASSQGLCEFFSSLHAPFNLLVLWRRDSCDDCDAFSSRAGAEWRQSSWLILERYQNKKSAFVIAGTICHRKRILALVVKTSLLR